MSDEYIIDRLITAFIIQHSPNDNVFPMDFNFLFLDVPVASVVLRPAQFEQMNFAGSTGSSNALSHLSRAGRANESRALVLVLVHLCSQSYW